MRKRIAEAAAAYDACWDSGKGSHHPDYDPLSEKQRKLEEEGQENGISSSSSSSSSKWRRADRVTEELYAAIVADDLPAVYRKLEQGADPNFEFGLSYKSKEGYSLLMVAAHRGRLEAAKALLRAGADPNHSNRAGDAALFWAIDGGVEMIRLFVDYGADLNKVSQKGWTALQYAKAKGKYGAPEEKGVYPEVREQEEEEKERERGGGGREEEAFFFLFFFEKVAVRARQLPLSSSPPSSPFFSHRFFFFLSFSLIQKTTTNNRTSSSTTAPPSTAPAPRRWAPARRASRSTPGGQSSSASAGPTRSRSRTLDTWRGFFFIRFLLRGSRRRRSGRRKKKKKRRGRRKKERLFFV